MSLRIYSESELSRRFHYTPPLGTKWFPFGSEFIFELTSPKAKNPLTNSPENTPQESDDNSHVGLYLIAITVASIGLRWWSTGGQSITFDEHYEIELAKNTVQHILNRGDGFPPLYGVLLKSWMGIFPGANSARIFSILTGAIGCLAIYQLGKQVAGRSAGLWSAGILAVLPLHLFYCSEGRAYPLLLLITTWAILCILRAIESNRMGPWIGFTLLATAGLHTHYLFALFVAITLSVAFLMMRGKQRISSVLSAVAILVLIVPLVVIWSPADFAMQNEWTFRVDFGLGALGFTYGSFLMGYTLGPSLRNLHGLPMKEALVQVLPWMGLIGSGIMLLVVSAKRWLMPTRASNAMLFPLVMAPLAMGILCNVAQVGYQVRYSLWALIPCVVLLGWLCGQGIQTKYGRLGIACLAVAFAVAIWNRHYVDDYRNADMDALATFLQQQSAETAADQPIIVVSGYMAEPLKRYMPSEAKILGIPMTAPYSDRELEMAKILNTASQETQSFWLVYTREFHEDPDGELMQQIEEICSVTPTTTFAGVQLFQAKFANAPAD